MKNVQEKLHLSDKKTTIEELKKIVKQFVNERDWSQFHDAKNLSMVISTEAAELMEILRWIPTEKIEGVVKEKQIDISHELVDILWGCICFANRYDIDLSAAFADKLILNTQRYPADKARARVDKYTAYITPAPQENKK